MSKSKNNMKINNIIKSLIVSSLIALSGCSSRIDLNTQLISSEETNSYSVKSDNFKVVKSVSAKLWDKIELIRATDSGIPAEKIHHRGRHRDSDIVSCFGTDTPSSTDFCLHDSGSPSSLKYTTPVLLIHGANTTATRAWADPDGDGKKKGLSQYLKSKGFRVFAVTFANKHGDNFIWSSHINRAISRIKQITKAESVDTLGHSKGGFALRLYTSNVYNGQNPFGHDVRKAIFVGTPHRGIDFTFRHPVIHWALFPENDDPVKYAPLAWTKLLWQGQWQDSSEMSFEGNYFPGQSQMVAKWDKKYPLSTLEQDWHTTYYGGQGFVSQSPGIDKIIKHGGNLVEKVRRSPVDPSVKVAVLAGSSPTVPGILNEITGPSDGVLFLESAKATSDLTSGGAELLAEKAMLLNHLQLVSDTKAMEWISQQLAK